jgi:hypothetical protein
VDGPANDARVAFFGIADLPGFGHFLLCQADIFDGAKVGARDLCKLIATLPAVPLNLAALLRGVVFVGKPAVS